MTETRDLIPTLTGPIRSTQQSHQFNSTPTYDVPLDLSKFGFVGEEFFVLSQQLSTPTTSASSRRCRTPADRPRRPGNRAATRGGFVEILNPSNGYDAEGMWRRAWDYYLADGHAYVAFSAKPVTIDSLKIFDPVRYAPLSWDLDPANPHAPVGSDFNAYDLVEG